MNNSCATLHRAQPCTHPKPVQTHIVREPTTLETQTLENFKHFLANQENLITIQGENSGHNKSAGIAMATTHTETSDTEIQQTQRTSECINTKLLYESHKRTHPLKQDHVIDISSLEWRGSTWGLNTARMNNLDPFLFYSIRIVQQFNKAESRCPSSRGRVRYVLTRKLDGGQGLRYSSRQH